MPAKADALFSGSRKSEFEIPPHLAGKEFFIEIWGRRLGRNFWVHGEFEEDGLTKQEALGSSFYQHRVHIPVTPRHRRLIINGGSSLDSPGRWNVLCSDLSELPELSVENEGTTSRMFAYHGGERRAQVQFEGRGAVLHYDFDRGAEQELVGNTGGFSGTITIPKGGIIAVTGHFDSWGPMQDWKLTLSRS